VTDFLGFENFKKTISTIYQEYKTISWKIVFMLKIGAIP